ncbi:hypothetical protein ACRZ9O_10160 [Aquirufa sp. HETE-40SA]
MDGINVYTPANAIEKFGEENPFWVVTIWSPGHSYRITYDQLLNLGISNVIPINRVFQIFSHDLLPYYHFETPDYYLSNKLKIEEAFSFLEDEESRIQFIKHLKVRVGYSFIELPTASTNNQYFPEDIVKLTKPETFLDCGAYTGDTLNDYLKFAKVPFKKYICL